MTSTVTLFASVVIVLVVWWCLLVKGIPALFRIRFERTATEIQRELDEAVLSGRLPLGDSSVEALSRTLEAVVTHSDRLTPAYSKIMKRTMNRYGRPMQVRARSSASFADLTAGQRRLMHDLDGRLTSALTFFVKYGSVSGWLHTAGGRLRPGAPPPASPQVRRSQAVARTREADRRARPGEALTSTRLAMTALLDPAIEPGLKR